MVHFHLSLSGCGMGSLETSTHVILMPESHKYYPKRFFLPNCLPTHYTNRNVVISDQHSHNPDKNVVISGMCRLKGNDNYVVISKLKHTRCLVLVILYTWRKSWLGYAEYTKFQLRIYCNFFFFSHFWARWDDTCGWWCVGQRRWISYTTICTMKSKNDWRWVRWDETPPVHMHKTVVCKNKKKNSQKGLFWNIQERSRLERKDLPKKKKKRNLPWNLYERFTNLEKKKKTKKSVEIGLHHLPLGEKKVKYKMFPSVLSRCGMGSLETCTHIILRPKTHSFISAAKTYYYYYYFLRYYYYYIIIIIIILLLLLFLHGDMCWFQTAHQVHKIPAGPWYCDGLQTAHQVQNSTCAQDIL